MNFLKKIYSRFFSITTSAALESLEKSLAKLDQAHNHHSNKSDQHEYAAQEHEELAAHHAFAANRALRVRNKIADLIG